ncbi:hypothetical protein Tco_1008904 [Tanacetum coccineum]
MWLKLTLLILVKRRSMLELYLCATGVSCTTMGRILSDYPELKNQNHGNQAGGTGTHGMFVEEPVEIMDREVKQLKQSRIPIVKVRWNSRRGPEFTWEREDQFQKKYLHLFTNRASSSNATS